MTDMLNLRELDVELNRSRRSLDDWSEARIAEAVDIKNRHERCLHDQNSKIQGLDALMQQALTVGVDVKARILQEREKEAAVQSALSDTEAKALALQRQLASLQADLGSEQQRMDRYRDDLRVESSIQQKRLDALRRAVHLFSDRLGLEFRHGADELHVVFTQVDVKQPDRPFVLSVRIQTDNSYEVTHCAPAVDGLPGLVERLNSSNDFSTFVKAVRSAFVNSARS